MPDIPLNSESVQNQGVLNNKARKLTQAKAVRTKETRRRFWNRSFAV